VSERRARSARPPDRTRSQHFIRSASLAAELVRDADIRPNDLVLDLGAGSGRLTAALIAQTERVIAVELDARLAERLRDRWPDIEVRREDAASVLLPHESFKVVANLPFDRTTAILRHLLDDPHKPLVRAELIVEWGLALKRAVPWPSTLNGVLWSAWYTCTLTRRLPRDVFAPPPRVDAGVLVFEMRECPLVPVDQWQAFRQFVASGFRHGLRRVAPRKVKAAPRELDAYQWAELFVARRR
jgi:23S rRNA (adenine-N6)-dimethyltransferase